MTEPRHPLKHSPIPSPRVAGALWLFVIIASIAVSVARPALDWRGDATALIAGTIAARTSIRVAFAVNLLGKLSYIGVTVLLYELLKPVNKSLALFSAFCGLAGVLSGTSLFTDFTSLSILEESRRVTEPVAGELQAAAKTLMAAHSLGSSGELVFFGGQIAAVGYLVTRSSFLPRAIGIVLLLGGAGFLITSFANFVAPAYGARLSPLILPIAVVGEGSLALWLTFKGVNVSRWQSAVADRPRFG